MIPDWFTEALKTIPQDHNKEILGANIHYQTWGTHAEDKTGVLFVHGHAAHAHWWDFIAPQYSQQFNVGAIDLSGSGDSDHRSQYLPSQFAEEITTIANKMSEKPILVAHSFGGSMARIAGHLFAEKLGGLILIDSVISDRKRDSSTLSTTPDIKPPKDRIYPSLEQGQRRFRLRPPQPRPADYILDQLSKHSLKQEADGFRFKLDQQVFDKLWPEDYPDGATMIRQMNIPTAYLYGSLSRFCPPEALVLLNELFPDKRLLGVEGAYHHVFLDQPEAFVSGLSTLLEGMKKKV